MTLRDAQDNDGDNDGDGEDDNDDDDGDDDKTKRDLVLHSKSKSVLYVGNSPAD
jgi:hypothetical protein